MADDVLYHYTDATGLLGILKPIELHSMWASELSNVGSLTLRASDVRYLNDRAELRFGAKILSEVLDQHVNDQDLPKEHASVLRTLSAEVAADNLTMNWATHRSRIAVHAACLSQQKDQLSQWRGYGANGGGYAIGISRDLLQNRSARLQSGRPDGKGASLYQVHYGLDNARKFLSDFISSLLRPVDPFNDVPYINGERPTDFARLACMYAIAQVKHQSFDEEQEWRLITDTSGYDFTEFRTGRNGLIPYVDLCINPKQVRLEADSGEYTVLPSELVRRSITSLVVGPGPDQELRVDAARRLMHKNGYNPEVVTESEVPYRA